MDFALLEGVTSIQIDLIYVMSLTLKLAVQPVNFPNSCPFKYLISERKLTLFFLLFNEMVNKAGNYLTRADQLIFLFQIKKAVFIAVLK